MNNFNEFFPHKFVINLKEREDRKIHYENEFKKHNILDVQRWDGIKLTKEETLKLNPNPSHLMLLGNFGLNMTTIKLLEYAKEKQYEYIFIFEDDIVLNNNFNEKFNINIKNIPNDWKMIYLGCNHKVKPIHVNGDIYQLIHSYAAHGIGIHSSIYDELLDIFSDFKQPNDVYYTKIQAKYPCYCFYRAIAHQLVDISDIQKRLVDYRNLIT